MQILSARLRRYSVAPSLHQNERFDPHHEAIPAPGVEAGAPPGIRSPGLSASLLWAPKQVALGTSSQGLVGSCANNFLRIIKNTAPKPAAQAPKLSHMERLRILRLPQVLQVRYS